MLGICPDFSVANMTFFQHFQWVVTIDQNPMHIYLEVTPNELIVSDISANRSVIRLHFGCTQNN